MLLADVTWTDFWLQAFSGIVAGVVGGIFALIGVRVANHFTRREAVRRDGAELFRRTITDSAEFYTAVMAFYKMRKEGSGPMIPAHMFFPSSGEERAMLDVSHKESQERRTELLEIRENAVHTADAALTADSLAFSILFPNRCEQCLGAIQDLRECHNYLSSDPLPDADFINARMRDAMSDIREAIIQLASRVAYGLSDDD